MYKLKKIIILCFASLILFSCDKEDPAIEDKTPYFGIAGSELKQTFVGESDTRYITVSTNTDFSISSSAPTWCSVEIIDDKVDNLKISVTQNTAAAERTASITVSSANFDDITITVIQNWIASIVVDKSYVLLNNDILNFTLNVSGNIGYEIDLPSWITEKEKQSDGTHIFEFQPISPGERTGEILVKSVDESFDTKIHVLVVHREKVKKIGSWLFEDPSDLTKATIGNDLQMVINTEEFPDAEFLSVEGPTADKKAVRVPLNSYFFCDHAMIPKEGENNISEYTLYYHFKFPASGKFYSFFQTNLANSDDGEIFIRSAIPPTIGVGATGYAGANLVIPDTWHTLYLSFKPGDVKFYLDGNFFHSSTTADARFRLNLSGVLLFGGPWYKKDDNELDVAEVSIWNGALSQEDIDEIENSK